MNTKQVLTISIITLLACSLVSTLALAQISQNAPPKEDLRLAPLNNPAGAYAKGNKQVNVVGGLGSSLGQNYLIIGGGISYFVADGLAVGLSGEGWILQDPTFWKVSPDVRYTFWKMEKFKPYLGAFYRHTFVGGDFEDYDSYGGRAGVTYRKGGSYVSLGVVHEIYMDCDDTIWDCSSTYPEISFWFSF